MDLKSFYKTSHYYWLENNLEDFFKKLQIDYYPGIIRCHGDKCYGYRSTWEANDVPFFHGVAIYLLTYERPFDKEVRDTPNGWVPPCQWVIDNYERFKPFLNEIGEPDETESL